MPFLIIFVIIPLLEVFAFIQVGDEIGVFKTLLLCVLTAMIGGMLVRQQGLETLVKAQNNFRSGQIPLDALFDGFCIVIAGAMLLTPGFVTDTMGFLLLIPPFRKFVREKIAASGKFKVYGAGMEQPRAHDSDIIEGDYETVVEDHEKLDKSKPDR